MKINSKQMETVLALPKDQRFETFIKVVADWEEVWGLYRVEWARTQADDGTTVFPLWPAKEYAQVCAQHEWKGFEPRAISLSEFMEILLPKLKRQGVLPGVFFTPASEGVTPPIDALIAALQLELQNY